MNPIAKLRDKHLDKWLGGYARHSWRARARAAARRRAAPSAVRALRSLRAAVGRRRRGARAARASTPGASAIRRWRATSATPTAARRATASSSPASSIAPHFLDALAELARGGFGEVEVHLHHDGDTATTLRADIADYLGKYAAARPPVARRRRAAALRVHPRQLVPRQRAPRRPLVRRRRRDPAALSTPAATPTSRSRRRPTSASRTSSTRSTGRPATWRARRAYEAGERARVGDAHARSPPHDRRAARARAAPALGVRIENGALTAAIRRRPRACATGSTQGIHVDGRPEWVFVKVHTHGAPEKNAASLLGDGGRALHRALRALQRRRALAAPLRDRARDVQRRRAPRWTAARATRTPTATTCSRRRRSPDKSTGRSRDQGEKNSDPP